MGAARGILQSLLGSRPRTPAVTPRHIVNTWLTRARAAQSGEGGLQRRSRQRWRWSHLLVVRSGASEFEAVAADISNGGVGVLAPRSLEPETRVWIRDMRGSDWVAANVRHVTTSNDEGIFRIGLEFDLEVDLAESPPKPAAR